MLLALSVLAAIALVGGICWNVYKGEVEDNEKLLRDAKGRANITEKGDNKR